MQEINVTAPVAVDGVANTTDADPSQFKTWKNRKQRRFEKALARRSPKKTRTYKDQIFRTIREFKGNKFVEEQIVSGKLDKYLE